VDGRDTMDETRFQINVKIEHMDDILNLFLGNRYISSKNIYIIIKKIMIIWDEFIFVGRNLI
jgi:hypothetical protein